MGDSQEVGHQLCEGPISLCIDLKQLDVYHQTQYREVAALLVLSPLFWIGMLLRIVPLLN